MAEGRDYLLDTNVLVYLARGKEVGQKIGSELGISESGMRPLVCRVTHGEVLAIARGQKWNQTTLAELDSLLRRFITVEIDTDLVLNRYAEIYHYVTRELKPARSNSENDIWIAAAAIATNSILVTADKWFDNIAGAKVDCILVDAKTGSAVKKAIS